MVSYRTLLFGTIAVISAASPAYAGTLNPLPAPPARATASTANPGTLNPLPAPVHTMGTLNPLPAPPKATAQHSLFGDLIQLFVRLEQSALHR